MRRSCGGGTAAKDGKGRLTCQKRQRFIRGGMSLPFFMALRGLAFLLRRRYLNIDNLY